MPARDPSTAPWRNQAPEIEGISTAGIQTLLPKIDVLLVTVTNVERDALFQMLRPLPGQKALLEGSAGRVTVRLGHFGRYFAAHVESTMGSVGRDASALTVADAIREIEPKAVLLLGIAFGLRPEEQRLGDVIVADLVFPYEPARKGDVEIPRGKPIAAGITLSERFRVRSADWVEQHDEHRVQVLPGAIVSGEKLVAARAFRDELRTLFRQALGGEMEGAGAYAAAARANVEILLVKAISDFADGEKSDLAQPFASRMAVSLAWHILSKPDVLEALGAHDHGLPGEADPVAGVEASRASRHRLLAGIKELQLDWANRIRDFLDAYLGTAERPEVFCGREEDVAQVEAWLERTDAAPNLLVTAPAGRGKSALLVRFAARLAERDDVDVAFVPWSLRFDTHGPDVFLGCLVARLAYLHGQKPPDLRRGNVDIWQGMLDDLLRPRAEGRRLVVLLDGLDEAVGWSVRPGLFRSRHPGSTRIVVAVRHQPDDPEGKRWLRALGWDSQRVAESMVLPLLDARDVEATLRRLPAPLDGLAQRHEIVEEFVRLCRGEPLTLWLMVGGILERGEAALDLDVAELRERAPGLAGWFELWWDLQRKQWGDAAPLRERAVRALLILIAVAEGGLTREDVLSLLQDEIPDSLALEDALRPVSRLIHGDGKTSGYVPAHPGFGQYLRDRLAPHERQTWRGRLATWTRRIAG
jgi:nucleoside phosphorylase